MPKRRLSHPAFTLIEVMIAVMIVSLVVATLLQMQGNANHKFFQIKEMMQTSQQSSFLLSNTRENTFEKSSTDMKTLLDEFELESDLRRRLSSIKVKIDYEVLSIIDTSKIDVSEYEDAKDDTKSSAATFEIGKTMLISETQTSQLIRVRIP